MPRCYRLPIIAVAGWLVLGPVLAVPPPHGEPRQPAQIDRNYTEPGRGQPERQYFFAIPFGVCASFPEAIDSLAYPDNPTDENYYKPQDLRAQQATACFTEWIFYGTLLQFGLACLGAFLLFRTIHLARDANKISRKALIAERRPWLKIKDVRLHSFEIREDQADIDFEVTYENVGNSPAQRINLRQELVEMDVNAFGIANDFAKKVRSQIGPIEWGETCFPGDPSTLRSKLTMGLARIRDEKQARDKDFIAAFIAKGMSEEDVRGLSEAREAGSQSVGGFMLIGSVTYGFDEFTTLHQTTFVYLLVRPDPSGPPNRFFGFRLEPSAFKLEELKLERDDNGTIAD